VNRAEWQGLAEDRVADAQGLLKIKRWSAAYYLAGYAVECALKACILGLVERTGLIFEDRKYAEKCWTHDLEELMRLAELYEAFRRDMALNPTSKGHWLIVKDWSEASRYRKTPHRKAKELYQAITDKANGVMPWIRNRW
jgi:HEPN domain-containing protein